MNILNLKDTKVSGNFTLFECIQSREWMDYLSDLSSDPPKRDLLNLFFRLAAKNNIEAKLESFLDIIENRTLDKYGRKIYKIFILWKLDEAHHELERAKLIFSYITVKGYYPPCMFPFMSQIYTSTQKAQQIYDLMDVWGDKTTRRIFFMLVFKYSNQSKKEKVNENPRKNKDYNFIIYEQAANGLWDYIEDVETNHTIVKCTSTSKKRVRTRKMDQEWVEWMANQGRKYIDVVQYAEKYKKNRLKYSRIRVFSDFISIYLKSAAQMTMARADVNPNHLESIKIVSKNVDQNSNE